MSLARTRSQALAAAADVPPITSFEQCQSILKDIASLAGPVDGAVSGISLQARDLTNTAITTTLKKHIPTLISLIDESTTSRNALNEVVRKAKAVLVYLGSAEYERELVERVVEKGLLDDHIGKMIDAKLGAGGGTGPRASGKSRKARNVVLEDHVHFAVADLCFVRYRKKSYTVNSPLKSWPEHVEAGSVEVDDGEGGKRTAWRPLWTDFHNECNEEFIFEVVEKVQGDFPDAHTEEDIRGSLEVYFDSILRQRRDVLKGVDEANKAVRRNDARTKSLSGSLTIHFPSSLLEQCKERDILFAALRSPAIFVRPLARSDHHGLPQPIRDEEGKLESGFDGFQLFLDRYEQRDMPGDCLMWVVRDEQWWSDLVRLGYWTLYEQSRPKDGEKPRTPLFHVPSPYRQELALASLPRLSTPEMSAAAAKRVKACSLTRGMVNDAVLDAVPYQEWCSNLLDDPAEREDRPSLQSLLDLPENAELLRRVNRHVEEPREYDDSVYDKMWALREAGRMDDYVKALRAEDSQAFLHGLNLRDLGFESSGPD